jgi:hypothetical protein
MRHRASWLSDKRSPYDEFRLGERRPFNKRCAFQGVCMTRVYSYQDTLALTTLEIPKALLQQHSEVLSAVLI